MRLYKSLFTLTIVLLFSTCAEKPTEVKSTGEVQGRVLDIKTGAGIENATVTIPTVSDKLTDISGFYQFKDIEEGTYSFVAEKTGYVSEIKQIVIEVNETKEVNFQLMKDEPVLSITPAQINFGNTETEQPISITNTGTGALTWIASENLNWLSLSPTSGLVNAEDTTSTTVSVTRAGLDQGSYEGEIAFVSNGGNDTLQVQMEVVPTLVVSESSLDFGTELTSSTLTVTNPGGGNLEWIVTNTANWLTISPTSGSTETEEDVITLLVDRTGLDGGDYSSTITFTSNGGNYTVSVVMRVPLPPALLVSPSSLDFGASTSTMNLNIINNGDGVLTWNVAADQGWLSTSPIAGETTTETDQVAIMVDRNNLEVGDYSGNITITTNGGNATIPITLNVVPGPTLSVTSTALDFSASQSSMTFSITNVGTQTLQWNISADQDWISVSPISGSTTTEQDIVTVTVDQSGLAAGDYSGSVTVTSNGGDQVVAVSMEILPPILVVSSSLLDFGEFTTILSFTISNEGTAPLNWSISSNQSWIAVNPSSGTTNAGNPTDVSVTVDRTDSDAGSYSGSIYVQSNGGDATIDISMIVAEFPAPTLEEPYNIAENSMTLAWSVITHEDFQEYRLYRSTSTGVSESSTLLLSTTNVYENTFSDDDLDDGTTYYYRVYSVNNYGVTAGSNEVYATTTMGIGNWGLVYNFDTDVSLNAIYAFSDENVWVAGIKDDNSIIYHFAGGNWIEIIPPNIGEINDIDFSSENSGWAVGGTDGMNSDGGVLYYNGTVWSIDENIPAAYGIDVNSADDVWFIDDLQGCYHYINGNYNQLALNGYDIQVEDDFGVIITDGGSTSIESYVYDGFSWVDGGYITYNSGSIFGKPSRLVMIDNENTYVALHGTSRGGVFHFDGSEWSTLWGGGYDHDARGIAAQSENSVWFYGTSWITWYIMHWDGNSVEQFDSQGTMNDIHFFEVQTGWSCGSNNVFRYN